MSNILCAERQYSCPLITKWNQAMIYEVIKKMAWNKFQCWNGLLRPYVELVWSSIVPKNNAVSP